MAAGPGPFLRRPDGLPMSRKWLTNKWLEEREEAPELRPLRDAGLVIHGLRGHACVRLFRKGYNTKQISELVGMSEDMVKTYTRNSEQRDNALSAVIQFEGTGAERKGKGFENWAGNLLKLAAMWYSAVLSRQAFSMSYHRPSKETRGIRWQLYRMNALISVALSCACSEGYLA